MVISRTPYRISFFGGGTDYPAWYRNHGGAVLATTINKYCHITCRFLPPFFEHRFRVMWSKIENCQSVEEITHPAVRGVITYLNMTRGLEIHHDGDLPARSGIGSSSSFTVGMLNALYALQGQMVGKPRLAKESIHIEQDLLKENVGSQDQVLAAHGGFNQVIFHPRGEITVVPMTLRRERLEELESHLMLFYTGVSRTASAVVESYIETIEEKRSSLRLMQDLLKEAVEVLNSSADIGQFGELLHENWQIKRELAPGISTAHVDELYEAARAAGAIGGKLCGAGGGGFLLLFVPPSKAKQVRERFDSFVEVPFRFESSGSRILFFDVEEDFEEAESRRTHQNLKPFRELSDTAGAAE